MLRLFERNRTKVDKLNICGVRAVILFCVILTGFVFSCLKIALINLDQFRSVSTVNTSKTVVLGESRGMIYDCNFERLVSTEYNYVCAVKPSPKALAELRKNIDEEKYFAAVNEASKGNPIKIYSQLPIYSEDVICSKIYKRYIDNQLAAHIIGYCESSLIDGISGIELGYNEILNSYSGNLKARFFVDGSGSVPDGGAVEKVNDNYDSCGGVVLTIDKRLQSIVEYAMDKHSVQKGAAVLMDIKTGAIKAIVSRPNFNPNSISNHIDDPDLALFNRALGSYPVGSVFKPLVAAAALEKGIDPSEEFDCNGSISSDNITFGCMKSHGKVNMASALVYSCNCYFINLMEKIDSMHVVDLASSLGFGVKAEIAQGIVAYPGNLPESDELGSFAERANFSFGQGVLTATPIQIASLYSMIANSGEFRPPYLVQGFCDEKGIFNETYKLRSPYKIISKENSGWLSAFLELAARQGTGKNATTDKVSVAGKTATAQSGDFSDGDERLVTWFAGFFPYESPEYSLVIMNEDGESGSKDCAPVFSDIVSNCF